MTSRWLSLLSPPAPNAHALSSHLFVVVIVFLHHLLPSLPHSFPFPIVSFPSPLPAVAVHLTLHAPLIACLFPFFSFALFRSWAHRLFASEAEQIWEGQSWWWETRGQGGQDTEKESRWTSDVDEKERRHLKIWDLRTRKSTMRGSLSIICKCGHADWWEWVMMINKRTMMKRRIEEQKEQLEMLDIFMLIMFMRRNSRSWLILACEADQIWKGRSWWWRSKTKRRRKKDERWRCALNVPKRRERENQRKGKNTPRQETKARERLSQEDPFTFSLLPLLSFSLYFSSLSLFLEFSSRYSFSLRGLPRIDRNWGWRNVWRIKKLVLFLSFFVALFSFYSGREKERKKLEQKEKRSRKGKQKEERKPQQPTHRFSLFFNPGREKGKKKARVEGGKIEQKEARKKESRSNQLISSLSCSFLSFCFSSRFF